MTAERSPQPKARTRREPTAYRVTLHNARGEPLTAEQEARLRERVSAIWAQALAWCRDHPVAEEPAEKGGGK